MLPRCAPPAPLMNSVFKMMNFALEMMNFVFRCSQVTTTEEDNRAATIVQARVRSRQARKEAAAKRLVRFGRPGAADEPSMSRLRMDAASWLTAQDAEDLVDQVKDMGTNTLRDLISIVQVNHLLLHQSPACSTDLLTILTAVQAPGDWEIFMMVSPSSSRSVAWRCKTLWNALQREEQGAMTAARLLVQEQTYFHQPQNLVVETAGGVSEESDSKQAILLPSATAAVQQYEYDEGPVLTLEMNPVVDPDEEEYEAMLLKSEQIDLLAAGGEPEPAGATWQRHVSKSTGSVYYFNSDTGENTYDRPSDYSSLTVPAQDEDDMEVEAQAAAVTIQAQIRVRQARREAAAMGLVTANVQSTGGEVDELEVDVGYWLVAHGAADLKDEVMNDFGCQTLRDLIAVVQDPLDWGVFIPDDDARCEALWGALQNDGVVAVAAAKQVLAVESKRLLVVVAEPAADTAVAATAIQARIRGRQAARTARAKKLVLTGSTDEQMDSPQLRRLDMSVGDWLKEKNEARLTQVVLDLECETLRDLVNFVQEASDWELVIPNDPRRCAALWDALQVSVTTLIYQSLACISTLISSRLCAAGRDGGCDARRKGRNRGIGGWQGSARGGEMLSWDRLRGRD